MVTPRKPAEAIAWGARQIDNPTQDWTRLCLSFVRQAYGLPVGYHNAATAWANAKERHATRDPHAIPRGAPVWFDTPSPAGHVALSLGDGRCLTTDLIRPGRVNRADIAAITQRWNATLLGWTEDLNGHHVFTPPKKRKRTVTMTTFGIDVSRYQKGLSLAAAKSQGFDFVAIKATEGRGWRDPEFPAFLAAAKKAGLLTCAYHFVRADSPAADQAANVARALGENKDLPVALDLEPTGESRPQLAKAKAIRHALEGLGHTVGLLYYPRWYWEQTGRPDLAGWDLWQSAYGNNPARYATVAYPGDESTRWAPYGGEPVSVLQFGSRIKLDGYAGGVDGNAYRGTRADLAARGWFKDYGRKHYPAVAKALHTNVAHADALKAVKVPLRARAAAAAGRTALAVERRVLRNVLGR